MYSFGLVLHVCLPGVAPKGTGRRPPLATNNFVVRLLSWFTCLSGKLKSNKVPSLLSCKLIAVIFPQILDIVHWLFWISAETMLDHDQGYRTTYVPKWTKMRN